MEGDKAMGVRVADMGPTFLSSDGIILFFFFLFFYLKIVFERETAQEQREGQRKKQTPH